MRIYTREMDAGLRAGFGKASLGKSSLISWDVKEEMKCSEGGAQVGSITVHRK